jgi:hypothetical protein
MRHDIHPARLLAFALLCVLACHIGAFALDIAALKFGYLRGWPYATGNYWLGRPLPPGTFCLAPGGIPATLAEIVDIAIWPYDKRPAPVAFWGLEEFSLSLDLNIIFACLLAQLGTPALLLGLRQTRRKFCLRKVHLLRALCLGIPFFAASFIAVQAACSLAAWLIENPYTDRGAQAAAGAAVILSTEILWWWCFCRRYLKAPHALGVACAGALIAALLCVLLALLIHSNLLWNLLA